MTRRRRLSPAAQQARAPLPPADLVDAMHDRVHTDPGCARAARTAPRAGTHGRLTREVRFDLGAGVRTILAGVRVRAGEAEPVNPAMVFVHVVEGAKRDESWDVPSDAVAWWEKTDG